MSTKTEILESIEKSSLSDLAKKGLIKGIEDNPQYTDGSWNDQAPWRDGLEGIKFFEKDVPLEQFKNREDGSLEDRTITLLTGIMYNPSTRIMFSYPFYNDDDYRGWSWGIGTFGEIMSYDKWMIEE